MQRLRLFSFEKAFRYLLPDDFTGLDLEYFTSITSFLLPSKVDRQIYVTVIKIR